MNIAHKAYGFRIQLLRPRKIVLTRKIQSLDYALQMPVKRLERGRGALIAPTSACFP